MSDGERIVITRSGDMYFAGHLVCELGGIRATPQRYGALYTPPVQGRSPTKVFILREFGLRLV